jgi:hypothetical protein
VYDPYLNLLYKFKPESNHHSLYLLAKDSHLYQMNLNIKSLQQKVEHNQAELENIESIKVSNKYNIIKNDEENEYKIHLINTFDDITTIMKTYKQNEEKDKKEIKLKLITNNTIDILLHLEKNGYSPKIYFSNDINKLVGQIDNIYFSVEKISKFDDREVQVDTVEEYKMYNKYFNQFYSEIINENYMSEHHPTIAAIDDTYLIGPHVGYFNEYLENDFIPKLIWVEDKNSTFVL